MEIDFSKIKNHHETIALIPPVDDSFNIMLIYDALEIKFPDKLLYLLEPQRCICRNKLPDYDFYVLCSDICTVHKLNENDFIQLKKTASNIPFAYKTKFTDETTFLISRLSKVEKIKSRNVFGIFFSSRQFLFLAQKVRRFLNEQKKISYLIFLNDISHERLTCIDGIEVVVLITCPQFFDFDLDVIVPIVAPFEVQLAFSEDEWDGGYEPNKFNPSYKQSNEIVVFENKIDILRREVMKREIVAVPYEVSEDCSEILDGRCGIASGYENEGDAKQ